MPVRGENRASRTFVNRPGPTVSSRLPGKADFFVRNRGAGGEDLGIDGKNKEGNSVPLVPPGRSNRGVRSRKQPAMVRRLKNTLQALNGTV